MGVWRRRFWTSCYRCRCVRSNNSTFFIVMTVIGMAVIFTPQFLYNSYRHDAEFPHVMDTNVAVIPKAPIVQNQPERLAQNTDEKRTKNPNPYKQDRFIAKNIQGQSLTACSVERTNFVYIKMIKSASETMVSMLRRFGLYRDLNFVLPVGKRIYLGWPYQIDAGYYRPNKRPGEDFNILCEHSVYNKTAMQKLMPANAVYFTTIREPFNQVKSMFRYYRLARLLNLVHLQDPFTEYIRNIEKYERNYTSAALSEPRICVPNNFSMTYNLMSFILGFPTGAMGLTPDKTQDDVAIDRWLRDIDNSFSLVMIVEYFDESLILLKRLMCWSWKDILYKRANGLKYNWKDNNDPESIRIYRKRSRVDYKLYDYFNRTFWKRVANEKDDFWGEVRTYKRTAAEVHGYCERKGQNVVYNVTANQWTKGFSVDEEDCLDMAHYYTRLYLDIKNDYDRYPGDVKQPLMKKNVC